MKNSVCLPREGKNQFVFRGEKKSAIENMDEGMADKWRWQWLEKTVDVDLSKYTKIARLDTISLKDCIRKIDHCGKGTGLLCRKADPMKYGTNGVATLTKHVQSFGHIQREVEK